MEEEKLDEAKPSPSLFPLFPSVSEQRPISFNNPNVPQWLCNSSFTTDLSVVNDDVSAAAAAYKVDYGDDDEENGDQLQQSPSPSYELVQEELQRTKKDKKKKRKRSKEKEDKFHSFVSAKSKDYYFDSHGDRDNLVYGRLYRLHRTIPFFHDIIL